MEGKSRTEVEGKQMKTGEEKEEQVLLPKGSQRPTAHGPLPLAHLQTGMRLGIFPDQASALKTGQGI